MVRVEVTEGQKGEWGRAELARNDRGVARKSSSWGKTVVRLYKLHWNVVKFKIQWTAKSWSAYSLTKHTLHVIHQRKALQCNTLHHNTEEQGQQNCELNLSFAAPKWSINSWLSDTQKKRKSIFPAINARVCAAAPCEPCKVNRTTIEIEIRIMVKKRSEVELRRENKKVWDMIGLSGIG